MAFSGALNASVPTCLCSHRAPAIRSPVPALTGRSGLAGLERRRTGATIVRRPSIQTYVAAVEESPAAEAAPSSSGEDKEFEYAIDFTNTDDLYKRFNELLERSSMEIKLGDRVTGTVARLACLSSLVCLCSWLSVDLLDVPRSSCNLYPIVQTFVGYFVCFVCHENA